MNSDILKGKWKQLVGSAKAKWGRLTDNELDEVAGDSERLAGLIQEKYGVTKEDAKRQIDDWNKEHDIG
ncbi:MAG: CsbD family protein [Verrucomicrobia bacterium]|nr:CsbD family protein [Verrucomicrobiota bacterium]MCH8527372.1 CsbD family protein [Kiritimatiellia bacterium]